jgi:hypothetical protein
MTIKRAEIVGKILREKYPCSTNLCPWDSASLNTSAKLFWVHVKECGRLL